jgi:hypothetical protein
VFELVMDAMPFPAMQALFDPLLPEGLQWYWKGDFVTFQSEAILPCLAGRRAIEIPILNLELEPGGRYEMTQTTSILAAISLIGKLANDL